MYIAPSHSANRGRHRPKVAEMNACFPFHISTYLKKCKSFKQMYFQFFIRSYEIVLKKLFMKFSTIYRVKLEQ